MPTTTTSTGSPRLIATRKLVVALPISAFFAVGTTVCLVSGLYAYVLEFLGLTLIPLVYLLTVRRNALKRQRATAPEGAAVNVGPNWLLYGSLAVVALLAGAGATIESSQPARDPSAFVPTVVGAWLDDAKDTLRAAGLETETEDDTGKDRKVWNSGNWIVTRQSPGNGDRIAKTEKITVWVVRKGETAGGQRGDEKAAAAPEPAPSSASPTQPPPTRPPPAQPPPAEVPIPATTPVNAPELTPAQIDETFIFNLERGGVTYRDREGAIKSGRMTCDYIKKAPSKALALLQLVLKAEQSGSTDLLGVWCDRSGCVGD